ncbi:MAG: carboxylating nicotinate-nucleotide diphosphorylase [Candidatus Izemoplasmatales bacterium]
MTIHEIIKQALIEDIPTIDVSSEYLFKDDISTGAFIAKEDGVISGMDICQAVFKEVDETVEFNILKNNGDEVKKGMVIATVKGLSKSILKAERVGLNFLQRMSGIASMTKKFVNETKGTQTKILDTRKTTPLLRILEKKAVQDGGGKNHRMSLSDMVMLKDNHLKASGGIIKAVEKVKKHLDSKMKIEVEVESIEQLKQALMTDADIIMLDNMTIEDMKEAVKINNGMKLLEASGNMILSRIKDVASTGVDYISVGALTHSYQSMDISLKF